MSKKRILTLLETWKAEMLGRFGGFSHRLIASKVFDKPLNRVTDSERNCIVHLLHKKRILVSKWRNGETSEAQDYARKVVTPKPRDKKQFKPGRRRAG